MATRTGPALSRREPRPLRESNRARRGCYRAAHREQVRAEKRRYYIKNRARLREQGRRYRIKNRERIKAKDRRYRAANRAREYARERRYRAAHREQIRARDRRYRAKNRERIKANSRRHRANNREQINAQQRAINMFLKELEAFFDPTALARPRTAYERYHDRWTLYRVAIEELGPSVRTILDEFKQEESLLEGGKTDDVQRA